MAAAATACANGLEDLDIYSWPGAVVGYKDGAVYARGKSAKTTVTAVPAKAAVKVKKWRT